MIILGSKIKVKDPNNNKEIKLKKNMKKRKTMEVRELNATNNNYIYLKY